jgi:hypothetical protein
MLFADPDLASWLPARLAVGRPGSDRDRSNVIGTWRKHKPPGRKPMIKGERTRKQTAMQKTHEEEERGQK